MSAHGFTRADVRLKLEEIVTNKFNIDFLNPNEGSKLDQFSKTYNSRYYPKLSDFDPWRYLII